MTKKQFTYYYLALSILTGIFLITKAVVSPLVMDEATTFINYAHTWDILPGQGNWKTNNHYLNTFLIALSTQVFGITEWAIRLPNLLAFLIFARYVYLWGKEMKVIIAQILFPLSVYAALFYIEFFAVARGYGLSIAFLLAGTYHQAKGLNAKNGKHQRWSFLFMTLSILANLNLQFMYLIWFAIEFWNKRKSLRDKQNLVFFGLRLIPIATTLVISFILKSHDNLDLGQNQGLFYTFKSTLFKLSYTNHYSWWVLVIIINLIIPLGWFYSLKRRSKPWQAIDVLLIFILGNIFIVWLNYLIFGVLYPVHRSAMHWVFLWIPAIFISIKYLPKALKIVGLTCGLLFIGFQLNYWQYNFSWNRNSEFNWRNEQIDETLAKSIFSMSDPEITTAGSFLYQWQWRFLGLKLNPTFPSQLQTRVENDTLADFLLSATADTLLHPKYAVYKTDAKSKISLLKRKKSLKKIIFARLEPDGFETTDSLYSIFSDFGIPTMGKQIGMRLEFDVNAETDLLKSAIIVHFMNAEGYKLWDLIRLDNLYDNINSKKIVVNFLIPSQTESEIIANVSFLNFDQKKYKMTNVTCYFYALE